MTRVFEQLGWVDVFRRLDPRAEQYTWWSNLGQAYAKNVGWRIDYQVATPGVAALAKKRKHLPREALQRPRASRHRLRLHAVSSQGGELRERRRATRHRRSDMNLEAIEIETGRPRARHRVARPRRRRQRLRADRAGTRPRGRRPGPLRVPACAGEAGDDQQRLRDARLVRHPRSRPRPAARGRSRPARFAGAVGADRARNERGIAAGASC